MDLTGTNGQGIVFLILFAAGAGGALVCFLLSAFVQIIGNKILRFICDLFCVLFCGAVFYSVSYFSNMGEMRFYVVAGFVAGLAATLLLCRKFIPQKTIEKISDRFKASAFYKKMKK